MTTIEEGLIRELTERAQAAETSAKGRRELVAFHETRVAEARELAERDEAKWRGLRGIIAMLNGEHDALAPRDIVADEGVMGLRIGVQQLAPPDNATVADLRLYVGTMRALYDQASHQARLVCDELRRRESQATQTTARLTPDDVQDVTDDRPRMVVDPDAETWTDGAGEVWDLSVTYTDREGRSWRWSGGVVAVDPPDGDDLGQEPLMSSDDPELHPVPIRIPLATYGPLRTQHPDDELTAPDVIDGRAQLADAQWVEDVPPADADPVDEGQEQPVPNAPGHPAGVWPVVHQGDPAPPDEQPDAKDDGQDDERPDALTVPPPDPAEEIEPPPLARRPRFPAQYARAARAVDGTLAPWLSPHPLPVVRSALEGLRALGQAPVDRLDPGRTHPDDPRPDDQDGPADG